MPVTKSKRFNASQKRMAELERALGHPARIAIIQILADRENCICEDITGQLPPAQSTVSQHLKAQKKAGPVKGVVDGVRTCYCLDEKGAAELNDLLIPLVKKNATETEKNCC